LDLVDNKWAQTVSAAIVLIGYKYC